MRSLYKTTAKKNKENQKNTLTRQQEVIYKHKCEVSTIYDITPSHRKQGCQNSKIRIKLFEKKHMKEITPNLIKCNKIIEK